VDSAPVLTARGLVVERSGQVVVNGIDLDLHRGQTVALLGPNGAGKSSLLAALAGLIPAKSGSVTASGRVAAAMQAPALARRTVSANVELGLAWWGVPRGERRGRAATALEQLGVGGLGPRDAASLSGGERRRVHLARMLAVGADVRLLDEPFAGLDTSARGDLIFDATSVLRSADAATLIVLHDRGEAWALADRLLVMLDGELAADGRPAEILEQPSSSRLARFLGFTGELHEGESTRMLRSAQVRLDPGGDLDATVARRVPTEDGVLLDLELANGRLSAAAPLPGPAQGERVRIRVEAGVVFPRDESR
jgi:ABC-type sulfate/molybdate transport systems ATPase subunit